MAEMQTQGHIRQDEKRKDHLVFFICLLLAATFWFLIKLSDIYSVSYTLRVHYTHVPKGKLITSLKDSTLTIHFKSDGYNLIDLLIHGQLKELPVDLSKSDVRRVSEHEYTVMTASLRENIAQELGINDRELEFSRTHLDFFMEQLKKIRLKVIPQMQLKFKSQYELYGYRVIPSKVSVYGPKRILDTLKHLYTRPFTLEDLSGQKTVKTAVVNPDIKLLKLYPSTVKVQLDVEKYTERTLQVPVDVSGIQPRLRTFPLNVTVYFNVFLRDYDKIHTNQFRVVPDLKNIDLHQVKKLRLELVKTPKQVSNVRLNPTEVEFIILN
ncbi:YbbR-like domain-containing protein [Candidatus Sulfidibacterium hydrothermale]|uniref:CdaR family protein n=1 Tax=Candidatus Sulfidibacterium hydrothermale TaxID=2875962 RepID=UPI001F0A9D4A|nr:YbbR-like domain-containing protein [Candidatus Sulfidibacterium hydrothermale]UBM61301.1 YbbR-like domain-containing protein [Candidatus Sulfidibacterium hydrothermale]